MADDSDEEMLFWDESVFRNEHVFEIGYVPESVLHHESQMDGLKYALNPAVRGSRLLNVILDVRTGTVRSHAGRAHERVEKAQATARMPELFKFESYDELQENMESLLEPEDRSSVPVSDRSNADPR